MWVLKYKIDTTREVCYDDDGNSFSQNCIFDTLLNRINRIWNGGKFSKRKILSGRLVVFCYSFIWRLQRNVFRFLSFFNLIVLWTPFHVPIFRIYCLNNNFVCIYVWPDRVVAGNASLVNNKTFNFLAFGFFSRFSHCEISCKWDILTCTHHHVAQNPLAVLYYFSHGKCVSVNYRLLNGTHIERFFLFFAAAWCDYVINFINYIL